MVKRAKRYKGTKSKFVFNFNFNWKRFSVILLFVLISAFTIYRYFEFVNIQLKDPVKEYETVQYLLRRYPDSFKRTLVVFEDEEEGEEKVKHVYLYAHNSVKNMSVLIYIPNWVLYTGMEGDFGSAVAIAGFRYAGEFKQQGRGVEYAIWQLEELLGMKIDEYIWFDSSSFLAFKEGLGDISPNTSFAQYYKNGGEISDSVFFFNSFVSKLNWFNLLFSDSRFSNFNPTIYSSYFTFPQVIAELRKINTSILNIKPYVIDLGLSQYLLQKEYEEEGGIKNYLLPQAFDTVWREKTERMYEKEMERERVRIEVYNGSNISGKAYSFGRKISNSGAEVVRFDNAPSVEDSTKFYVPNMQDFDYSFKVVEDLFPGKYELIEGRPSFMTTGDIVIILGKDISTMFSF
ncbi:MAG: LytR C-terminal domain-containing protein [Candidatus Dojkabacteria bacterium]